MAPWLLLATLVLVCPNGFISASEGSSGWPRITECRSPQLESFTCHWTYGDFHNISSLIKLQYKTIGLTWADCPDIVSAGEDSCFFSKEHTSLFLPYNIRLVGDNVVFDERKFTVDEIVQPDPPTSLKWDVSQVDANVLLRDIMVTWKPPPSSLSPIISLEYELQIKEASQAQWKAYDVLYTTYFPVTGLSLEKEYLLRVRCRQRRSKRFGEFSDVLIIPAYTLLDHPTPNPSKPKSSTVLDTRGSLQNVKKAYAPGWPSITECRSPEQETFTCYWTYGDFHNLSSSIRLQYMKPGLNWTDCPDNVSAGENSCYFNREHTSIWVGYQIRLVSENLTFDEHSLSVDDIVRPDSPIALNWTVLNISETRLRMDIQLTWKPPSSADVKSGWLSLEYQVQIKAATEKEWKSFGIVATTYLPVYGLNIGKEYLVRVRCRQQRKEIFGEFSPVLMIPVIPSIEQEFPWPLFIIIGLFMALIVLLFFIICKKKRVKMLILPPVPAPKIKGIDPVLLQKGKLDEVSSILASHESCRQQLSNDDPWVEFIELDLDDQDEKNEGADTDRLLGEEYPKTHSCLGVKDDDSGRASCCEPDIPETDFSNSDSCERTSDTKQPQNVKDNQADLLCLSANADNGDLPTNSPLPNREKMSMKPEHSKVCSLLVYDPSNVPTATQMSSIGSKPSIDFYALVSDITPAGRLLLSPGQRTKIDNEECADPAIQHPTNLTTDNSYVCDSAVMPFCAMNFPTEPSRNVQQSPNVDSYFTPESLTAATMSSHTTGNPSSCDIPVADYTSVHIINSPQNLVLNTTAPPGKEFHTPCGYMSPDQVNKVMP